MSITSVGQIDYNRILRAVRQEFRIVELKELLNEFGYGFRTTVNKAQLQSRVEDLLKSEKRIQVAHSIQRISKRLNGILSKTVLPHEMVRTGASSYGQRYPQNHPSMGRQPQFGMPSNFNTNFCDASKVRLTSLPFYDINHVLLSPTILMPTYKNDGVSMGARFFFNIPPSELGRLAYRDQPETTPRYEIQMRMALCETDKDQPDAFPNNVKVTINGALVNLPPLLNVQPAPGQQRTEQQKRSSRPVNITPYCNPSRDSPYQVIVEWQQDRYYYLIGIWLVYHVNAMLLRDRLVSSGPRYYEETRAMIKKLLGGHSEDDIAMDSLKISLICPLSRSRMQNPVRSKNCTHLQCFDLHNYLMMNEKRPNWKCPVCNKPCHYDVLVLDTYFADIIVKATDVNEVELLTDGNWKVLQEKPPKKQTASSSASASVSSSVVKPASVESTSNAPTQNKPPQSAPEIITLDDSDDDEAQSSVPNDPAAAASTSTKQTESRKRPHDQISATNDKRDYTVITLEDSDDDESPLMHPPVNQNHPIVANDPTLMTIPLLQNNQLYDNSQDSTLSLMDSSTVLELSRALLEFMQKLETDNTSCH